MKLFLLTTIFLICTGTGIFAQSNFPDSPDSARFITSDIDRFWKAFDDFKRDSTLNPFLSEYIAVGSPGVKGFTPNRIQNAEHLHAVVKKRVSDYERVRLNTLRVKEKEKQCRSTFYALKYIYPGAKFPPVYFVIGAYNSGGTSNAGGLFIGGEMQSNIDNIPYIVAHELIHFQQKWPNNNPTLLQQSILEGSADFLGEMISGVNSNMKACIYGNSHAETLCGEFVKRMNGTDYADWLYAVSKNDDRPNDLGYWMGYKIAEAYYNNSADKKQAVYEILNIKDYNVFLKKSGFLDKYL
ncbi:MAG TPA: DUF2268 domain-containing putative Zn-dependent protease [Mucilaginibacter sp.]|jgi:hypothetical protein|nr:DUF2268 domain-containing putative Zn-dependent protease [Mucilaginibacter sp.]